MKKNNMRPSEIEYAIRQAAASFRVEGMIVDHEDMENARRILRRDISGDEMVRRVIDEHGYQKNA